MSDRETRSVEEILRTQLEDLIGEGEVLTKAHTQVNQNCGDEISLSLKEGSRIDLVWSGRGCRIMLAGASLMTSLVRGLDPKLGLKAIQTVLRAAEGLAEPESVRAELGPLDVFSAERLDDLGEILGFFSSRPNRRECFLLAWRALEGYLLGLGLERG